MKDFAARRRRLLSKDRISGELLSVSASSGSLVLKETAGRNICSFKMSGNTETSAYSGKNTADPTRLRKISGYSAYPTSDGVVYVYGTEITLSQGTYTISPNIKKGSDFLQKSYAVGVCRYENRDTLPNGGGDILFGATLTSPASVTYTDISSIVFFFAQIDDGFTDIESAALALSEIFECIEIQIEQGDSATNFEEYIKDIPDPKKIRNTGDEGITLKTYSTNLINEYADERKAVRKIINGCECYDMNADGYSYGKYSDARLRFPVSLKAGTYNISFNVFKNSAEAGAPRYWELDFGYKYSDGEIVYTATQGRWSTSMKSIPTEPERTSKTVTFGKDVSEIVFSLYLYGTHTYMQKDSLQITKGEAIQNYCPYVSGIEINIPKEITEGETTTELSFAQVGDTADYITADRRTGKIIYRKNVCRKIFNGDEVWSEKALSLLMDGKSEFFITLPDKKEGVDNILCTHLKTSADVNLCPIIYGGTDSKITVYGFQETANNILDFKKYLAAQAKKGTPFTLCYPLKSFEEYDLSEYEWARKLLLMPTGYGTPLYLDAKSDIPPSVHAEYYTLGDGDKCILTVIRKNQNGEALEDSLAYEMRKNTLYKVFAPETNGYVPTEQSKAGSISEDKTVTFIYEEKNEIFI